MPPHPKPPPAPATPDLTAPPAPKPLHQGDDEVKLCGVRACQAVFAVRPQDVVRAYVLQERVHEMRHVLQWCARNKKAYKVILEDELSRVAESTHHEGVCLLVKRAAPLTLPQVVQTLTLDKEACCVLGLEDVGNPHNVGAILRVCAHFGVKHVVCLGTTPSRVSASLARTAEGGSEHTLLVPAPDTRPALMALRKAGFTILGTSHTGSVQLYQGALPARVVLLLGSEGDGLAQSTLDLCDGVVSIGGSGAVESLNVACAATALLGDFWRQHHAKAT